MLPPITKYLPTLLSISVSLLILQPAALAQGSGSDLDSTVTTILIVGIGENSDETELVVDRQHLEVAVKGIPGHSMDAATRSETETNTWTLTLPRAIRLRDIDVTPVPSGYTWERTDVRYEGKKVGRFLFHLEKLWQIEVSSDPTKLRVEWFNPLGADSTSCRTPPLKTKETFNSRIHVHNRYFYDFNLMEKDLKGGTAYVIEHKKVEIVDRVLQQNLHPNWQLKLYLNEVIKTNKIVFQLARQ